MEAERFQDLQPASWRPSRADGVCSSLKAGRFETQEELRFQSSLKARKDQCPSSGWSGRKSALLLAGGSAFLFFSGLPLIG